MALGEYVSVSSQRDSERAEIKQEKRELADSPEAELTELTALYEAKGLSAATARTVATELTAHGALSAHLDAELHIDPADLASPAQAAGASALSFVSGALLPMLAILLPPAGLRVPVTFVAVLVALAPDRGPQRAPRRQRRPPRRPARGHRRSARPGLHLRRRAPVRHRHRLIRALANAQGVRSRGGGGPRLVLSGRMRCSVRRDLVADADLAVAEHVGAQAALVDERAQRAGLARRGGQALEVRARLAQPLAEALDVADAEVLADEGVEVDAAGDDVPAGVLRGEATRSGARGCRAPRPR